MQGGGFLADGSPTTTYLYPTEIQTTSIGNYSEIALSWSSAVVINSQGVMFSWGINSGCKK
jgi:hypothetical protein